MSQEIKYYYVVGLYSSENEVPYKIYKVTTSIDEATIYYMNYLDNPKCYIGSYRDNKLINLGQYRYINEPIDDGPGIFKFLQRAITIDDIADFETD